MQNVVVDTEQSLVKIIDFGLSNYWSLEEPLSTHCGSPEYAAPELFVVGQKYGPEVDLWSLGVILFCMSAGHLPFYLNEREQTLSRDQQRRLLVTRIRKGIVQRHKNSVSHYSKEFSDLLCGLLVMKPFQRLRIEQVLCHPWTTKSPSLLLDIPKNIASRNDINGKIIMKMCAIVNSMHKDVEKRIRKEPLGPVGGIHRILHHKELKKHWRLFEAFSPLHTLSGSLSSGSLITRHHNQINLRTTAGKAKPAKTSSQISRVDSAYTLGDSYDSDIKHFHREIYPDSGMDFRQEPWFSNLSSSIINCHSSLIVANVRSKNCPYNCRRTEQSHSQEEILEVISTIEADSGRDQSDTSTATTTRMSTLSSIQKDGNALLSVITNTSRKKHRNT